MPNERNANVLPSILPDWVPREVVNYLAHTLFGQSIRGIARQENGHASTIMRQIRRLEMKRDDPLFDDALAMLEVASSVVPSLQNSALKENLHMTSLPRADSLVPDDETLEREARRVLRRLCEPGACLAVAAEMEKAVVVRDADAHRKIRTAVVDTTVVQAMALRDWVTSEVKGKISRYSITAAGRSALKRLLEDEQERRGFSDQAAAFDTGDDCGSVCVVDSRSGNRKYVRYGGIESPIAVMARRRGADGSSFLSTEQIAAAERIREDFEMAEVGGLTASQWQAVLSGENRFEQPDGGEGKTTKDRARSQVANALAELGPGLADVVLRVCCFLEGLEAAERRMGWSARSGKIVLRIALQRLARYYSENRTDVLIG